MTIAIDGLALRERAFASLRDIDLCGVAAVPDTAGTPLHDSAVHLMPEAQALVVLGWRCSPRCSGWSIRTSGWAKPRRASSTRRTLTS